MEDPKEAGSDKAKNQGKDAEETGLYSGDCNEERKHHILKRRNVTQGLVTVSVPRV